MLYIEKKMGLKAVLCFAMSLCSFSIYADNSVVYLKQHSVDKILLSCTQTDCFFPGGSLDDRDIYIADEISWDVGKT